MIQWALKEATLYHSSDDERAQKENAEIWFLQSIYDTQKKGNWLADSQAITAHCFGMKSAEWELQAPLTYYNQITTWNPFWASLPISALSG